ncbi:MAG: alpha/beta hydrolase-fold protein [Chloroflexi bacterium]|nr:alpha/beta hydrolase-fold protein [Chloroflexota bacterium]
MPESRQNSQALPPRWRHDARPCTTARSKFPTTARGRADGGITRASPWLGTLQIWLDTAVEDPWLDRAKELHDILTARGIDHVWQEYPGGHDWTYWHEHAVDYIRFYAHALARK